MKKVKPSLDKIRCGMTSYQKKLLQEIWQHFQTNDDWPILRTLYSEHGKQKIKNTLSLLGGSVGREERGSKRWSQYKLFLLGILLTKDGPALQSLLARFFKFERDLFKKEPHKDLSTSVEVAAALGLNAEETKTLGHLLWLGHFGGGRGGQNDEWSVSAMDEVEGFSSNTDFTAQVENWVLRFYQPDSPVFIEDQHRAQYPITPTFAGSPVETTEPHPPEITVSLEKLRKKYPDQTKLGFLMMRFAAAKPFQRIVNVIKKTAENHGLVVVRADENEFHANLFGNVQTLLHGCRFGIAVIERIETNESNANVGLEVGYLMAMNKPVLLLKDRNVPKLQTDLAGRLYKEFDPFEPQKTIPEQLTNWLADNGIIVPKRV